MAAQLDKFSKNHWIVHLQWVNFMACNYINKAVLKNTVSTSTGHAKHAKETDNLTLFF